MAQPMRALIDTGRAITLELQIYDPDHSSSFPSSILHFPLIAPTGLNFYQHLHKST
jgi:hypothetical protein